MIKDHASTRAHDGLRSELLDAWLHDGDEDPIMLNAIWDELQYARAVLERVSELDFSHALAALYCAAYRWHLANSSSKQTSTARHRLASDAAMEEIRSVQRFSRFSGETTLQQLLWC